MVAMSFDVIALIIEHVDDKNTLFSLLTVNRQVFRQTCRVLYRDPFGIFRKHNLYDYSIRNQEKRLLQLLLTLSPAADDDSNLVRSVYNVPAKSKSEAEVPSTMMFDYLSAIKCVRWKDNMIGDVEAYKDETLLDKAASSSGFNSVVSFIHSTATRMICQHRLDGIEELEMEVDTIDRYIDLVPHFRCLRYISIPLYSYDIDEQNKKVYLPSIRFIQAFQQHYGKDRLLDYCAYESDHIFDYDHFCQCVWIAKLLPPRLPHNLKLSHPIRPIDSHLSRITSLATMPGIPSWWDDITKEYTDISTGHILQRCRSLTYLELHCDSGGIQDAYVLGWAADEARQRASRGCLYQRYHWKKSS